MAKMTNDHLGRLAEKMTEVELLLPVAKPFDRPLFRPVALGDKHPTADFLVEVLGSAEAVLDTSSSK
jgi:hypothetical protein